MTKNVNEYLFDYQVNGECVALIEHFKPFIYTYVKLISTGYLDMYHKHLRYFIALSVQEDETRKRIRYNKNMTERDWKAVKHTIKYIKSYFYFYSEEDIFNELLIPFLRMSKQYKFIQIDFTTYAFYNFNFFIKHYLREITKEPNDFVERTNWYNGNAEMLVDLNSFEKQKILFEESEQDIDVHDYRFMRGDKCAGIFSGFTNIQRFILVHKYIDKWTDKQIAEHLGMHINSIQRARVKLVKKLKQLMEQGEIRCLRISEKYMSQEELLLFIKENKML